MVVVPFRRTFDLSDPESLKFDLSNFRPKEMIALVEAFEADVKANPTLGPLPVPTGWVDITPTIAIDLLRRNRPGANRKVDPATCNYYALQMVQKEWKATGQPVLIDNAGHLVDAQHRLYAIIISGETIRSFVVTDVEAIPNLFAYIDNSRPRTLATALQTAGFNGAGSLIAKVFKLAEEVRLGVFDPTGLERLPRLTPAEALALTARYPNAKDAARAAASDWSNAVSYLSGRRKDLVAYLGMRISDLHGFEAADAFFEELVGDDVRSSDDPIGALRKVIDKDNRATKPMKRQGILAAMILAFNAWHKEVPLKGRWMQQINEGFPILDPPEEAVAAE
jgi:hypothetical protein